MVLTLWHVGWVVMALPVFITLVKMFWNAAEFFISAKINLTRLTETVAKIEKKLDDGMAALQDRVAVLERKEDIRHAIEEDHNGV